MTDRPTGVTIVAILAGIAGALHILSGAALVGIFTAALFGSGSPGLSGVGLALGIFTLAIGIALLPTAAGLWVMSKRFWRWALILVGLSLLRLAIEVVLTLFNQPSGKSDQTNLGGVAILAIVDIAILFYLTRPAVRDQFEED